MTAIEHDAVSGAVHASVAGGVPRLRWLPHTLLLSFLLGAIAIWLGPGVYTIDENAYRVQAAQLVDERAWGIPLVESPGEVPSVEAPLALSDVRGDVFYPYARHAAYPALLAAVDPLAPSNGGLLLSALAMVALALAAGLLTEHVPGVDGRVGFWVAGTASPFLVHSQIAWAHVPAAASFAAASAVLVRAERWSPRRSLAVGVGLVLAVLLRTEALIACGGLLVVVGATFEPRAARVRWAATIGVAAASGFLVDRLLFRWATGGVGLTPTGIAESADPFVVQRLQAMVALFLDVGGTSPQHVARLVAAILLVVAMVMVRRGADLGVVATLAGVSGAAGLYGALNGDPYGGLLAAWPLLGPALVVTGTNPIHRRSVSMLIVTWLALVAMSPPDGGGLGWGGRLGVVVLVVAVPIVAHALVEVKNGANRGLQLVIGTAALLSVVVSVVGLRTVDDARATSVAVEAQVSAALTPYIGGDQVLVSTDRRLGRIAPDVAIRLPLQSLPDDGGLEAFLDLVDAAGVENVIHIDLFDNDAPQLPAGWRASEPQFDDTVRTISIQRERS